MQETIEGTRVPELELVSIEEPEIGDDVRVETPQGTVTATWLGVVSNGKELARAMRLMCAISDERRARDNGKNR